MDAATAAVPLSRRALRELRQGEDVASESVEREPVVVEPAPLTRASIRRARAEQSQAEPASCEDGVDSFNSACRAFLAVPPSLPVYVTGAGAAEPRDLSAFRSAPLPMPEERTRSRFLTVGASVGIMGVAGLLAVSMTLPAGAVAAAQSAQSSVAASLVAASEQRGSGIRGDEIQAFVASSDLQNGTIERADKFSTASLIDIAHEQGIDYSTSVYTNDPDAAIQWPFMVGVGMSYGYGMRDGRLHEGLDLVPGDGAPVQAIAGGTVRIATETGGNYGVTVYIDHMIDGDLVTSHYSHMQYGSLLVKAGQMVEVGDVIGKVGNTGRSFGAHLHFELIIDGATIDPLPWLQENAGRYDGVVPVS
ncbi:M23 family metallopeptidase [Microbacterium sp. A204]|uniref:M23 family metallopeptidase n=1 Tax=Microbacterium sp. A204 TaxID=3457321 RepID=UPI003FD0D00E